MTSTTRTSLRLLALLSALATPAWATGVVHIPEPTGGWSHPIDGWYHANSAYIFDQGITFGDDFSIVPTIDGLSFVRRDPASYGFFEFVASELQISDPASGAWVSMSPGIDFTLSVTEGVRTGFLLLQDIGGSAPYPGLRLGSGYIGFGDGSSNYSDTDITRASSGVLQINGQTIITQNALTNYVTLDGTQTLTNKSINAGQLTGSVTAAKGGTGLTSYTAGDLLYANGTSSLGKLAAASSGNVLLSGTSPSWGKVGLTTHVSGTLPVANGGTGSTSLIGILKGNGTGAVTTVAAPAGALVGTTDTQTLSNKTLSSPQISGPLNGGANGVALLGQGISLDSQDSGVWIGGDTIVQGNFMAGATTSATGQESAAFGDATYASGPCSVTFGTVTYASGYFTVATGISTHAKAYASLALGQFNVAQGSETEWVPTDDLLTLGNGNLDGSSGPVVASNALALHKNGKLRVANTVESKGGFRTPKMGDIEMGLFTAGPNPATLNEGLRYSAE